MNASPAPSPPQLPPRKQRLSKYFDLPNWVLAITILAGLVTFITFTPNAPALSKAFVVGLTLLYLAWTFFVYEWCEQRNTFSARTVYFGVALALVLLIFYFARISGGIWLIVFPLASQSSQQRRGWPIFIFGAIALGFFGMLLWLGQPLGEALVVLLQFVGGLSFVFVFTRIAMNENKARLEMERLANQLREANQKLSEYAAQAEELAITRERNRVAREIHDSLGHYLTVVNVQIEAARTLLETNPAQATNALNKAQSLTKNGLTEIRRSVAALRTSPLDGKSLVEAVRGLIEEQRATGIATHLSVTGQPHPLDAQIEITLYRAAQEALTNIRKHARNATEVKVSLSYGDDDAELRVSDNGINKDNQDAKRTNELNSAGFGLLGLRERAKLLGGELQTHATETGFTLLLRLPISNP
jgi:signal transduction histidine kinase